MSTFRGWLFVAKEIWIPVALGWLSLLLPLVSGVELAQAGALMVCAGVVAEIMDRRSYELIFPWDNNHRDSWYYTRLIEVEGSDPIARVDSTKIHMRGKLHRTDEWPLYRIATQKEMHNENGQMFWHVHQTATRLRYVAQSIVVITVVVGTLLWAFA